MYRHVFRDVYRHAWHVYRDVISTYIELCYDVTDVFRHVRKHVYRHECEDFVWTCAHRYLASWSAFGADSAQRRKAERQTALEQVNSSMPSPSTPLH